MPAPDALAVDFSLRELVASIGPEFNDRPTSVAFGPDERLYVSTLGGKIYVYTLDDAYQVVDVDVITAIAALPNHQALGLAFSPRDGTDPVRLYVSHNWLEANGGDCFEGSSPYSGQISVLAGPDFDVVEPVVTGLPVSNHDHGVNGMDFDDDGNLYVAVGSATNAGVPTCLSGGLPESPLSAAVLIARIAAPDFDGAIAYRETDGGAPNDDQVFGDVVDVAPGAGVSVFAAGLRNPYDLTYTSWGLLYATDNGPGASYGPASTGPASEGPPPVPTDVDELDLLTAGAYYGHPNRNRGRTDPRQNVYYGNSTASVPGVYEQGITLLASSADGIVEYRSAVFGSEMRGDLVVQKLSGATYRVRLSADKRAVVSVDGLPVALGSLDLTTGPGGVLVGADHVHTKIWIAEPVDSSTGLQVFDVQPWRAPLDGGMPFVLAGKGFGSLANTSVTVGAVAAVLTSVSATRIRGFLPAAPHADGSLVDVVVTVAGTQATLAAAFRYLCEPGQACPGPECLDDTDCSAGQACVAGACQTPPASTTTSTLAPPATTSTSTSTTLEATTTTSSTTSTSTTTSSTTTTTASTSTTTSTTTTLPTSTTTVTLAPPTTTTIPAPSTTLPPSTTITIAPATTTTIPPPTTTLPAPTTTVPAPTTTLPPPTTTVPLPTTTLPTTTTTTLPSDSPYPRGDVNLDGRVTAVDALAVLRVAVGVDPCSKPGLCDLDQDGSVTATDALTVLRLAVGVG